MKRINTIKFIFLLGLFILRTTASAISLPEPSGIFIFPDRSWALSGDTVWFAVSGVSPPEGSGNVVHIHLENLSGEAVSRAMVLTSDGKGEGYLPVPDSLGSGVYWLRAYTGAMRKSADAVVWGKLIPVYHRFEEEVPALLYPPEMKSVRSDGPEGMELTVTSGEVAVRGEVSVQVTLPENAEKWIREMVISAGIAVPGEDTADRYYPSIPEMTLPEGEEEVVERDGFYIRGRIVPASGSPLPEQSLVLLSIPGAFPWFDYCLSDKNGHFRFRLNNAWGTANVYLRALGREGEELKAELTEDLIRTGSKAGSGIIQVADTSRQKFVKEMLEADFYKRLFSPEKQINGTAFDMKRTSDVAFYGIPDHRVIPSEYIHLPDFSEICRELLPAARFRKTDGQYSLRMLDDLERKYFDKSPLRLINGVPVFNDQLLFRLKSSDILSIDLIYQERVFGDLSFKGVMAITLNDNDMNWLSEEKNLSRFTIPCLQKPFPEEAYRYPEPPLDSHMPDLRRVFLFQRTGTSATQSFRFRVSDLKGTVLVKISGITMDNQPFSLTRKIVVK
ncbi:MAG TPA: hypothetical protein PLW67_00120 [Prolixibacteraceae bacterium]|nr:hypothetical protein [Prolixibacteraceae bacterium]